jgi:tyrosine-protein kinase Etk/Wzc
MGPPMAEDPGSEDAAGLNIERYVSAILRHKWLILLVTVAGAAGGFGASRFMKPTYQAQATVWVESSDAGGDRGPIRSAQLLESVAWVELLQSFTVLDSAVQKQHLYLEPASESAPSAFASFRLQERFRPGGYRLEVGSDGQSFTLLTKEGATVQKGRLGEPIGLPAGFTWQPDPKVLTPGKSIEFAVKNPRDVAAQLRDQMQAKMQDKGNFLRITLDGTNPERIAGTVNAVLDRYIEVAAQLKRSKLDELTKILEEQRQVAENNLRDAEIDLESFRVATITLPTERSTPVTPGLEQTQDPVFSNFFQMRTNREALRNDREEIQRVLSGVRDSSLTLDALAAVSAVQNSTALQKALGDRDSKRAELRTLRQRYTDEYDPVHRLVQDLGNLETQTIPRLANNLVSQLASQEAELDARINSASGELQAIPPRMTEEARLERRVAIAENLHTTLKQRYEEARLAAASSIPDVRILDRAVVPTQPTDDKRMMVLLAGLVGGLGLAVAGALLFDRIDPRVRYPDQVTRELGMPILSSIPHLAGGIAQRSEPSAGHALEAFRELRLNVRSAHGSAGPVLLTVTSPESGDGKSFVSSNLAMAFAEQRCRTLLIDGDIRRGKLHHLLSGRRSPGLLEHLAGEASAEAILQSTPYAGVTLVSAGTYRPDGPELLGSVRMRDFLLRMRTQFDAVIVDSSPLGAGVDPYILGSLTQNVLMVLRTGSTNRGFAGAKMSLFDRLPVRLLGVALNDVPPSKIYRYYSYLPSYQGAEAPEEVTAGSV